MRRKTVYIDNLILTLCLVLAANHGNAQPSTTSDVARQWTREWGDKWWERYHHEVESFYPGGKSNHYHDLYIKEAMKNQPEPWSEWEISNNQYLHQGEWFAVEWFYRAVQPATGKAQIESTLAFGKIEDDHLRIWIEYFDDMVGRYQTIGAMKFFDRANEVPFPWPEQTALRKAYRP